MQQGAGEKAGETTSQWRAPIPTEFVGVGDVAQALMALASTIAVRQSSVLLLGETGTGKELLARCIHFQSPRHLKPFIPVDCSAISETLFESELFGHVRGAFTGAISNSIGMIRAADGGTLFLDEIGEMSLPMQAKLLRVLQERTVRPVGETRSRPVDIRLICATNRDLEAMVECGEFRADLYYRINVMSLRVPPLRERREDILPLARHFLRLQSAIYDEPCKTLSPAAGLLLERYDWPGNIRELANVVEHAHVLGSSDGMIDPAHLPPRLHRTQPTMLVSDLSLEDVERRTIAEALRRTRDNKAAASRLLGINIQRLNRRIKHLKIHIGH